MANYILLLHDHPGATRSVEYYATRFAEWLRGIGLTASFKLEREHASLPVLNIACSPDVAAALESHDDVDVITPDRALVTHL